jgi:hypothetical protein
MAKPADFLGPGPVPLHTLTEVVDVREVRGMKVCCELIAHTPKEGCGWWKICGDA